jgi:hypothetical protein
VDEAMVDGACPVEQQSPGQLTHDWSIEAQVVDCESSS